MSDFNDMKSRVINAAPCPIRYEEVRPPCYPFGTLIISVSLDSDRADQPYLWPVGFWYVSLGDLTVLCNAEEIFELCELATEGLRK